MTKLVLKFKMLGLNWYQNFLLQNDRIKKNIHSSVYNLLKKISRNVCDGINVRGSCFPRLVFF